MGFILASSLSILGVLSIACTVWTIVKKTRFSWGGRNFKQRQEDVEENSKDTSPPIVVAPAAQIPYTTLFALNCVCPQLGLILCLAVASGYHWKEVTSATCLVDGRMPINVFPSISACIGDFPLNREIWGAFISLYVGLRLPTCLVFLHTFSISAINIKQWVLMVRTVLHVIEQLCLIGLTVVTSRENLFFHQVYFALFWIASILNLVVTTWINYQAIQKNSARLDSALMTRLEMTLQWRLICCTLHLVSSLSALSWYFIHESQCGDYQYTYFAVSEWLVVFSNIYFHMAELGDSRDLIISVKALSTTTSDKEEESAKRI